MTTTGNEPSLPYRTGDEPELGGSQRIQIQGSIDASKLMAQLKEVSEALISLESVTVTIGRRSMLIMPQWGIKAEEIQQAIMELANDPNSR